MELSAAGGRDQERLRSRVSSQPSCALGISGSVDCGKHVQEWHEAAGCSEKFQSQNVLGLTVSSTIEGPWTFCRIPSHLQATYLSV